MGIGNDDPIRTDEQSRSEGEEEFCQSSGSSSVDGNMIQQRGYADVPEKRFAFVDSEPYDFGKHKHLLTMLDDVVQHEGRMGLETCDRSLTPFIGLTNQGATCYLNSLLQSLFFCSEFRSLVYQWEGTLKERYKEELCIPLQLQRLFARLQFGESAALSTKGLTTSFGWKDMETFEQQDVQELSRVLFDSLERYKNGTEFAKPFKGSLVDYIICLGCGHKRVKREEFLDLSLVVQGMRSLGSALDEFVKVEKLDGDNQYFCEHCDVKVDAIKGHRLCTLPKVLVLHMKRFVFDWKVERRIKLQETVELPMEIDVANLVGLDSVVEPQEQEAQQHGTPSEEDSLSDSLRNDLEEAAAASIKATEGDKNTAYTLSAILVHSGSANSGHYYTIVRTGGGDSDSSDENVPMWYEFNDAYVTPLTQCQVDEMCSPGGMFAEGGAYMLFYSQQQNAVAAKDVTPSAATRMWIAKENSLKQQMRQVINMDKQLARFRVVAGPAVVNLKTRKHADFEKMEVSLELHKERATVVDALHLAYARLVSRDLQEVLPLARCRLRRFNELDGHLGAPFTVEEQQHTLSELDDPFFLSHSNCARRQTLMLEFLRPEQYSFAEDEAARQKQVLQLCVYFWDAELVCAMPAHVGYHYTCCGDETLQIADGQELTGAHASAFPRISVGPSSTSAENVVVATVKDLKLAINCAMGIPVEKIGVLRFDELCKFKSSALKGMIEVADDDNLDVDLQLASGDGILVVCSSDVATAVRSVVVDYKATADFITLFFNNPLKNQPGVPADYEYSIKVAKNTSFGVLKPRLLKAVRDIDLKETPISGFHLKRSVRSTQFKDPEQTLAQASIGDRAIVHIGKGTAVPLGHTMLRLYTRVIEEGSLSTSSKARFKPLFRVNISDHSTVGDLRKMVAEKLQVASPQLIRLVDRPVTNMEIVSNEKEKLNEVILRDGPSLRSALKHFNDGRTLDVQVLDSEETLSINDLVIKVARFDVIELEEILALSSVEEHTVKRDWTIQELVSHLCGADEAAASLTAHQQQPHTVSEWEQNAGMLNWVDAQYEEEHDQDQQYSAAQVISKFPLNMTDGAWVFVTLKRFCRSQFRIDGVQQHFCSVKSVAASQSELMDKCKAPRRASSYECGGLRISAPVLSPEHLTEGFQIPTIRSESEANLVSAAPVASVQDQASEVVASIRQLQSPENPPSRSPEKAVLTPIFERSNSAKLVASSIVPGLDLANIPDDAKKKTYQEEFMANKEDWSDSWCEAIKENEDRKTAVDTTDAANECPPSFSSSNKRLSRKKKQTTLRVQQQPLQDGQRVVAKAEHWKRLFPGTIFSHNATQNTFVVDFDDGDRLDDVPPERIRAFGVSLTRPQHEQPQQRKLNDHVPAIVNTDSNTVCGLENDMDLCPKDKKERRKDKLAARNLRLQLMFMNDNEPEPTYSHHHHLQQQQQQHQSFPRPQSSPIRTSKPLDYNLVKPRRIKSSFKLQRNSKTLAILPSLLPAASTAGLVDKNSSNNLKKPALPSFLPTKPCGSNFKQNAVRVKATAIDLREETKHE